MMNNAAAAHVSMRHRLRGPALSIATACAASAHAIGEAAEMIRAGRADVMIAGGADAPIVPGVVRAWEAMRVLAPPADDPARTCRPFSKDRLGMTLGEGAGIVVLESWERAHGARRHDPGGSGRLRRDGGRGAHHAAGHACAVARDRDRAGAGRARAGRHRLRQRARHRDAAERRDGNRVLKLAFGAHAPRLAISSTKAVHGHAMGASAALEFIATVLAMRARHRAADGELHRAGSGVRSRLRAERRAPDGGARRHLEFLRLRRPERGPGPPPRRFVERFSDPRRAKANWNRCQPSRPVSSRQPAVSGLS